MNLDELTRNRGNDGTVSLAEVGLCWLGAATAADRATVHVAAGTERDGKLLVALVGEPAEHTAVQGLYTALGAPNVMGLTVDPRSDSAVLARDLTTFGAAFTRAPADEVSVAIGRVLDALHRGDLVHLDQPALTAAIRSAQRSSLVRALRFGRGDGVDPAPLLAAALAVSGIVDWLSLGEPQVAWERSGDPSRLPAHLERQAEQIAAGFPPPMPVMPGAPGRDPWARD